MRISDIPIEDCLSFKRILPLRDAIFRIQPHYLGGLIGMMSEFSSNFSQEPTILPPGRFRVFHELMEFHCDLWMVLNREDDDGGVWYHLMDETKNITEMYHLIHSNIPTLFSQSEIAKFRLLNDILIYNMNPQIERKLWELGSLL